MADDTNTAGTVDAREALAERLFESLLGAMELFTIHLGTTTGLYEALASGPSTAAELAEHTGVDDRYLREWLEQQATAGLIEVDDAGIPPIARRWSLPDAHREVLLEVDSPFHLAAAGPFAVGLGATTEAVAEAYRTGDGVAYADYGAHIRRGIASFNRPMVVGELASVWLPGAGEVHERLRAAASPRILDVGSGLGRTTIELARAYPYATVEGVDMDPASVDEARKAAAEAGVADRVSFTVADAARHDTPERYDLVTCFEILHDTGDPVGTLRNALRLLAPGGRVLIGDDRGAEAFTAPGEPYERLLYGFSVLHCLPATRAEDHVHAHGTVVRPADALGWIAEAGFTHGEVLDIDNEMWRFYLATP